MKKMADWEGHMHRASLLLSMLLLASSHTPAAEPWLSGEALTRMVSGNTAYCRHLSRPSSGRTYFAPDGTMHGIRRGEPRSGTWHVSGDTLCTNWGEKDYCSRYQSDGNGGHYKLTLAGKRVVHIEQWQHGDKVDMPVAGME